MIFKGKPILEFKGLNGHIYLYKNHLTIKRLLHHMVLRCDLSRTYTLSLSQIAEIHFKRSGLLNNTGYVRIIATGKDASYISFLNINHDKGTVTITKNNNDFLIRFINRVHELKPSINILDLDDPAIKGKNEMVHKLINVANSGIKSAGKVISSVDSEKVIQGVTIVGACVGEEAVKQRLNLKYQGYKMPYILKEHTFSPSPKLLLNKSSESDTSND
jgi:hypothetical protein